MEENKLVAVSYSDIIPHDVVFDILVRVPTKSVLRFRCVSKSFFSLTSQPAFIEAHKKCSCLDHLLVSLPDLCSNMGARDIYISNVDQIKADNKYNQLDFSLFQYLHEPCFSKLQYLGSSNGLVCLWNEDEDVAICNPFMKEHVFLPKPTEKVNYKTYPCVCSLGFDPMTNKYKVVKALSASIGTRYWIFTLGVDKSWRESHCLPFFFPTMNHCVYIDGVIYSLNLFDHELHDHIMAFNVGEENFRMISLPQGVKLSLSLFSPTIVEIKGEVALLDHKDFRGDGKIIYMYFLNKGSCGTDDRTTWVKKQTIELPLELNNIVETFLHCRFTSTSKGEIVLIPSFKINSDTYIELMYSSLFFYDTVGRKKWKKFELRGVGEANFLQVRNSFWCNVVATTWSLK